MCLLLQIDFRELEQIVFSSFFEKDVSMLFIDCLLLRLWWLDYDFIRK